MFIYKLDRLDQLQNTFYKVHLEEMEHTSHQNAKLVILEVCVNHVKLEHLNMISLMDLVCLAQTSLKILIIQISVLEHKTVLTSVMQALILLESIQIVLILKNYNFKK